jgi:hypothetical protein
MQPILTEFVLGVTVGEAQAAQNLTVFPLMSELPTGPEYLTLSEALAAGTLSITEMHAGGSVPELTAVNTGPLPVLLLDGEEVVGAKQNRVLNTTLLIREHAKTVLPVSCVEQGRWRYDTPEFHDSNNVMAPRLRARKQVAVTESLAASGERMSDQGEVWDGVAELAEEAAAPPSPTGAMHDVYAHADGDITALLRDFAPLPGQRGMVVCIHGRPAGAEYVSQPRAFAKVFEKLLRGYALEALISRGRTRRAATPADAAVFLGAMTAGATTFYEAIGYGVEHRITGKKLVGSVLTVANTVIHVSLLAAAARKRQRQRHYDEPIY